MALAVVCSFGASFVRPLHTTALTTSTINFQARLEGTAGAIVPDGTYNVQFKLYDASSAGTLLWTETRQNSASQGVAVTNGYLSVALGSVNAFPTTINWDQQLYLTMNIGGTSVGASPTYDGEMSPRLALTAVPYAFRAGQLAKLTGANTSTLDFATQTAARSILLPDASGTLCIQSSTSCGFALSTGGAGYIQNTTGVQTGANLAIQSTGTSNVTALIRQNASQTADLLQFQNSGGVVLAKFDANGVLGGANGSGSNVPGSAITIGGGQGTGTGVGGDTVFKYSPAGVAGSALNALQTACTISGTNGSLSCPGSTAGSERFGTGSAASGGGLAVGNGASALFGGNGFSTALGNGATANSQDSLAVGYNAVASAQNAIAIGYNSSTASSSLVVGTSANTDGNANVVVGNGASATGGWGNQWATVLGAGAGSNSQQAIAIGSGASANNRFGIAIGVDAATTATNQLVIGSNTQAITNFFVGNGVTNAGPSSFTLQGTGGSGTDIAGASVTLAGGKGTGTGNGGSINFQIAKPGTTGSSLNSLATVASLSGINGAALFQNSANSTTGFQIQNAAGAAQLTVDTTTGNVAQVNGAKFIIGTGSYIQGTGNDINIGDANGNYSFNGTSVARLINASVRLCTAGSNGACGLTVDSTGVTVGGSDNSTNGNSTKAFQIQNSAGTSNLLVADTTNNLIGIGQIPVSSGSTLQVAGTETIGTHIISTYSLEINNVGKGGIYVNNNGTATDALRLDKQGFGTLFNVSNNGETTINSANSSTTPLKVTGASGQSGVLAVLVGGNGGSADLLQLQGSTGTVLAKFDANGVLGGANGSGSNVPGSAITLGGGQGTGTGNGGSINFQIAKPGTTGSSLNSLATVASLSGINGSAVFKNATNSTTGFQVQNAAGAPILTVDTANQKLAVANVTSCSIIADASNNLSCGATTTPLIELSGHSYVYGVGASSFDYRYSTLLAGMLRAGELNHGVGGAAAAYDNNGTRNGGYAQVLQDLAPTRSSAPYLPQAGIGVVQYGVNDIAYLGGAGNLAPFKEALRTILARYRASAVFEETSSTVNFSGSAGPGNCSGTTWGQLVVSLYNSGSGLCASGTNGSTTTITTPSDFPGGTIDIGYTAAPASGAVHTYTVDGGSLPSGNTNTLDTRGKAAGDVTATPRASDTGMVKRIVNLPAGAHTIVDALSSVSSASYFDYWSIEAPTSRLVMVPLASRMLSYSTLYSGAPYMPTDADITTLNTAIQSVTGEFDSSVKTVDIDSVINKNANYFYSDGGHLNDQGQSLIASAIYKAIQGAPLTADQAAQQAAPSHYTATNNYVFRNGLDSTTAFQVQNAAGAAIFSVDATNQRIGIGTTAPAAVLDIQKAGVGTGGVLINVRNTTAAGYTGLNLGNDGGYFAAGLYLNGSSGTPYGGSNALNLINFQAAPLTLGTNNAVQATIASNGATTFKNSANSTTAFQIQSTAGVSLFTVDTAALRVTIGGAPSATPTLLILSTKNTSGDPTCTNGAIYYNSATSQSKICINGGWTAVGVPKVSSLPGTPSDGDEVYYDTGTAGVVWHLRYNSATTYWDYLGGAPLLSEVAADETLSNCGCNTYRALTTAGPSITTPLFGDYDVKIGAEGYDAGFTWTNFTVMSYDIGATGAVDADGMNMAFPNNSTYSANSRVERKTGIAANTAFVSKYKQNNDNAHWRSRWMQITPVRVK